MTALVMASAGLAVAGAPGALAGLALHGLLRARRLIRRPAHYLRPILLLLLVELKSGGSALGALQAAADVLSSNRHLALVARVATISGLSEAVVVAKGELRNVLSQLARAQRSGAPLAETVRGMIEAQVAADKASRLARARTLPVRLMIPITLLLLPGLVLLFYAPSLLSLFEELSGPLS